MTRLAFEDLTIRYTKRRGSDRRDVDAVKNVNLVIESGATLGLAGESGSGKSTLAMSVLRLLPKGTHLTGRILVGEENVPDMSWGRLRAVRWTAASVVFQGAMHALNPVQRIRDQIGEALVLHASGELAGYADPGPRSRRVDELLTQVDLPRSKGFQYPHQLSGGQKQRVMLALALACDPEIIIADEPTTALDVLVQDQILQLLKEKVRARGLTLIMISHDMSVLAATCDQIAVLYQGEIVEVGPSTEIMAIPQHEHTRALATAFPTIGDWSSRLSLPGYTAPDAPGAQAPAVPADPGIGVAPREASLEVRHLTVEFGHGKQRHVAVNSVDLICRAGEITALVGQSGSGKTTLARAVLGLQSPTSGEVLFRGRLLSGSRRALREYRRRVQYVLQDPMGALNGRHTVYEQVSEGLRLQGLKAGESEAVHRALEAAGLVPPAEFFQSLPGELSGGQRQRVVIAGALALNPEFIVADEPVASVDASKRAEILALFLKLRSERGLGGLIITHDLGLAWNIADRVAVMYQGQIVESGAAEEVLLNPQHEYTRRLLAVVPLGVHAGKSPAVEESGHA